MNDDTHDHGETLALDLWEYVTLPGMADEKALWLARCISTNDLAGDVVALLRAATHAIDAGEY